MGRFKACIKDYSCLLIYTLVSSALIIPFRNYDEAALLYIFYLALFHARPMEAKKANMHVTLCVTLFLCLRGFELCGGDKFI